METVRPAGLESTHSARSGPPAAGRAVSPQGSPISAATFAAGAAVATRHALSFSHSPYTLPHAHHRTHIHATTMASATEVTLYTCPTGGWVFGNRKAMENAIKKELPNCSVKHKLDWPFSAHVSINGVKGKRECGPFMFFLPCGLATACCDATVTGKNAKELADKVGDAGPPAVEMTTE